MPPSDTTRRDVVRIDDHRRNPEPPPLEVPGDAFPYDNDQGTFTRSPRDLAERAVLGAMLGSTDPDACASATLHLTGGDFHDHRYELIYDAAVHLYSRGKPVDLVTVADQLGNQLARVGGMAELAALAFDAGSVIDAGYYAALVAKHATIARLDTGLLAARESLHRAGDDATPNQLRADVLQRITDLPIGVPGLEDDTSPGGQDIDAFLGAEDDPYDWLIPDLLERTDRLVVTAGEGVGKSTLLRQIAVQAAAGIHPVTLHDMPPVKVLLLDLENSTRQSRRKLRPMRLVAGRRLDPTNLVIEIRIQGIDLGEPQDVAWLDSLIDHHKPDLLVTGPIYKMASGDPNDERETKPVVQALDALRAKHQLTLILEAHTKKAEGTDPRKRAKDPVGWSGWRRWPEFGIHLSEEGEITHWRGARDERTWPHQLNKGGAWPWTPATSIVDQRIAAIKNLIRELGHMPSLREIQAATGIPRMSAQRLLTDHAAEFETASFWAAAASDDTEESPS